MPHSPAGELEMRKNLSKDFKGATRMALMRASKWAPTCLNVSADISTFISYPDLIQRLAIKGISGVSQDLSSGGSFRSSLLGHSRGTLENYWEVFLHFDFPCWTVTLFYLSLEYTAKCELLPPHYFFKLHFHGKTAIIPTGFFAWKNCDKSYHCIKSMDK